MLIDARTVADQTELAFDLVIVGAGPAGISIADRLRGSGLSVCLIEGGGEQLERQAQSLFRGEVRGRPYFRLDSCRLRVFGGSSNRWGGWCRPLEAHDFETRDWTPNTGWPIGSGALEPYYADAARLMHLPHGRFDLKSWAAGLPPPLALDGTGFENTVFPYSFPQVNFARTPGEAVVGAPDVTTLLHANVIDLRLDAGVSRVGQVQIATLAGGRFTARGRAVVLAGGGIENARLLLSARSDRPAGLGNENDQVGRHFMEHLHVPAGHLALAGDASIAFYRKSIWDSSKTRGVITPTPEAQRRHALLTCSISIEPERYWYGTPFMDVPAAVTVTTMRLHRRLQTGRGRAVAGIGQMLADSTRNQVMSLATARASRAARHRAAAEGVDVKRLVSLYFRAEQLPEPESRVTLSRHRDGLGSPQARLDWRVGDRDFASITEWLGHLRDAMRDKGLGTVIMPAEGWAASVIGGPHHMGTTRMSAERRHGVVDADCRVHTIDNLYVAGSSVFATGGYANPTFTLVALALRLADHLIGVLGG